MGGEPHGPPPANAAQAGGFALELLSGIYTCLCLQVLRNPSRVNIFI